MDFFHSLEAVIPISNICTMTIEYIPMPCHNCSLLSISDSIPSPIVSNHAWFFKEKEKKTASSYTLCPHEYAYI